MTNNKVNANCKKLHRKILNRDKQIEDFRGTINKLEREIAYVGVDVWNRDKTIKHTDDLVAELRKENDDLQNRSGDYLSLVDIRDKRIANLELTILKLEDDKANAFRVLNLRDERIKQLQTRELELAEKIDSRNLPPQDSITDKPRHIKNLGIDRDGNVVVFTHHLDKVRK